MKICSEFIRTFLEFSSKNRMVTRGRVEDAILVPSLGTSNLEDLVVIARNSRGFVGCYRFDKLKVQLYIDL